MLWLLSLPRTFGGRSKEATLGLPLNKKWRWVGIFLMIKPNLALGILGGEMIGQWSFRTIGIGLRANMMAGPLDAIELAVESAKGHDLGATLSSLFRQCKLLSGLGLIL